MKIRTDFVTNSSSSSFITIEITNQNIQSKLIGTGLDQLVIDSESEDTYETVQLQEFYTDYLTNVDIVSCLKSYLKDKYNLTITRNDFIQKEIISGYGEANHGYVDEYGVSFDSFVETYTIVSENKYEVDGELCIDYVGDDKPIIEFNFEGKVQIEVLDDDQKIRHCIDNFVRKYGKECIGFTQIVEAYVKALVQKGRNLGDITSIMENYTSKEDVEKLIKRNNQGSAKITGRVAENANKKYIIDYENGSMPISNLPVGSLVVDQSWEWQFRTVAGYKGGGIVKPVTWIVVANDHYDGLASHVTLLSEELIGRFPFDDSTDRDHEHAKFGYNHWGDSGTGNARHGLRSWLNSSGIHGDAGFFQIFSNNFKKAILTTTLLNSLWNESDSVYNTQDNVFIPSASELGNINQNNNSHCGKIFSFFRGSVDADRKISGPDRLGGYYWLRSPGSGRGSHVYTVFSTGAFNFVNANSSFGGVRPVLNLKSEILVTEIKN